MSTLLRILLMGLLLGSLQIGISQDFASNTVFIELLGNGGTVSANYEKRFGDKIDGWGARVGFGYFGDSKEQITTVPLMVNRLTGSGKNHLELGAGALYVKSNSDFLNIKDGAVVGILSIMYRRQAPRGGFMWKIGLTPIVSGDGITPFWAGVGAGYAF